MNKCLYCGKPVKNKYCNVSCQNKHLNKNRAIKKYGEFKNFKVKCFNCNKEFEVTEREKLFPQKEKYFCSRSCSNKREHTKETKDKISNTLKNNFLNINNKKETKNIKIKLYKNRGHGNVILKCKNCNNEFSKEYSKRNQKFCSILCVIEYNRKNSNLKKWGRKGGLASAQKIIKRSRNEIYLAELCKKEFSNVLLNKNIFNGWDADIILPDFKLAILWNGKWHYEKITEKHSIKQVQNRDKIKIKEIINKGYKPYIIKDMGKYNKKFVENEFKKLKQYIAL